MKKVLTVLVVAGIVAGAYYLIRIAPILTTDNTGAEKVVRFSPARQIQSRA